MNKRRLTITAIVSIWLAAILQQAVAPRLSILGMRPDFLLVVLTPLSLWVPRSTAAILGFFCGFFQGAAAGANLTHYVISRTVAGFAGSWSRTVGFEINAVVVGVTAFLLTLLAQTVWMFLAAPREVLAFLGDTIGSAMYNGVLAIPVYMLLKRIVNPNARSGL